MTRNRYKTLSDDEKNKKELKINTKYDWWKKAKNKKVWKKYRQNRPEEGKQKNK